jgi:hypothetical protein
MPILFGIVHKSNQSDKKAIETEIVKETRACKRWVNARGQTNGRVSRPSASVVISPRNRIPPDFDPALHGTLNKYHGR